MAEAPVRNLEEYLAWLKEQSSVDFVSRFANGTAILVMTKSEKLVDALVKRGGTARWYDRTQYSTRSGKSKALMQCEVVLGPRFFNPEAT